MRDFTYHAPTAVYFSKGCIEKNGSLIASYGKKAFIITSRFAEGFRNLALDDIMALFNEKGIDYFVYDDVEENPSVESIKRLSDEIRRYSPDFLFGIGGGSALDTAKAANVLIKFPADSDPYKVFYDGKTCPNTSNCGRLPSLCVPTTAGSGSEVMGYAVLTRSDTHTKLRMNQLSFFEAAFLDAKYIENSPQWLLDAGAMDALAHGIEGYLNKNCNKIGAIWHSYGFELFRGYTHALLACELSEEQYEKMMAAATVQGVALLQSGSSFPHGMGYPLTHFKNVPHGLASVVTIPDFLESFEHKERVQYVVLSCGFESIREMRDYISRIVDRNVNISVTREEVDGWAEECSRLKSRQDRHPEPMDKEKIKQIYLKALEKYIVD